MNIIITNIVIITIRKRIGIGMTTAPLHSYFFKDFCYDMLWIRHFGSLFSVKKLNNMMKTYMIYYDISWYVHARQSFVRPPFLNHEATRFFPAKNPPGEFVGSIAAASLGGISKICSSRGFSWGASRDAHRKHQAVGEEYSWLEWEGGRFSEIEFW